MSDRLSKEIDRYFDEDRVAALVKVTCESYSRVAAIYSPEDGWDAQLFGFAVYKYVWKRLVEMARRADARFFLRTAHPALRIGVGSFTLTPYCCGYSGDQEIETSFPKNEGGAPALVALNQYCFEFPDATAEVPRGLILAHLGNSTNGLEALHLAVPATKTDGRISSWGYHKLLWRLDSGGMHGNSPTLPPPAPIDPAELSLKKDLGKLIGR